jgi:hypothetical protein
MRKDLATRVIATIKSMDEKFNALTELIGQIEDEMEQQRLRQPIAEAMVSLHVGLEMQVFKQHPDLAPPT